MRVIADSIGRERIEIKNSKFNSFVGNNARASNTNGASNSLFGNNTRASYTNGASNSGDYIFSERHNLDMPNFEIPYIQGLDQIPEL